LTGDARCESLVDNPSDVVSFEYGVRKTHDKA